MPFIHAFIEQLRAGDWEQSPWQEAVQELVDHLEARLHTSFNDGFDLQVRGDDERDRAALAAWLQAAAEAPPFVAPSWGRTFSAALAWLLRNGYAVSFENTLVAAVAKGSASVEKVVREMGMRTAYEHITVRRST